MEPGGDPFKFMMEIDRLAADLHRLGDKSVTELRKCVIIVSGMSTDFEMECRMLENNPAGLNRAGIQGVVGNQYNRLFRQQQDSKTLSAWEGTVTADRKKGKNRRPHHKFDGNCFNCRKKGRRAGDCRMGKTSENSEAADDKKKGGGSGRYYICGSEEHLAHRPCGLCKSLEHRTRDGEERRAEKGAMLTKLTVPAVPEVRAVAAMVGAAHDDRKEEWESDSGATFHMSHTRAGMSSYKKASPGAAVEIADGNILSVDGFGRIEVDVDQPALTTKRATMDDVAYVSGLSRNLLFAIKAVEQWGNPLIYYRNEASLGFPGRNRLFSNSAPARNCFSYRRETDPEAGVGASSKFNEGRVGEDRFGNGASDESGGIPRRYGGPSHACEPERGHNEKDGQDDGDRDDGPVGGLRDVLSGYGEATCRAKEDRRTGERERTAILCRHGRVDEALESRREQLRRHFRGRLHPLQGGKIR